METVTMTSILTSVGEVFTSAVDWMGEIVTVITSNPVLIILCIAMPVIGFAVGLLKRLTSAL